jgi:hypothetical protein
MRCIPCYTLPLEAVRVTERQREMTMWCVLHNVRLNVSKATIVTAILLVAYVTSEKARESRLRGTTVKDTARNSNARDKSVLATVQPVSQR